MAVEAAIFLPLFIIGILTIGYLLKFCMVSEGVQHALADEAHRIMAEAPYKLPIGNEGEIERRIVAEGRGEVDNIVAHQALYPALGVSKGGRAYTNLVAISVTFDTPLKLPRIFRDSIGGERTILCRAFVGSAQSGAAMPFSEMEEDDGGGTVWVFPRAGERYHGKDCSYIENNPREVLLDKTIKLVFSPCKHCNPGNRRDGTLVYCFEKSGKAYHTGECFIVDRYVIEIGKKDAEKQGYTPCSACGGGS